MPKIQLQPKILLPVSKSHLGSQNLDWHSPADTARTRNQRGKVYMMRPIVKAACGLWLVLASPLAAQTSPAVVVELYTSQGCSSCPPADAFLAKLADDPAVIPLALHVDYWDYIGWADSFANPKFTERQKAYAHAEGSKTIYTPQFIIGGKDRVVGHSPGEVAAKIIEVMQKGGSVQLWLERQGDFVSIRAAAVKPLARNMRIQLVRYEPSSEVDIKRGENAGHKITYHNIVTSWTSVGNWDGHNDFVIKASAPGDQPIVVIVQNEGPGPIVAAARIP
jgi:hypothetical protein